MKKTLISAAAMMLVMGAVSAHAEGMMGGLGFHTTDAPLGLRHWVSDKMAFDAGIGFSSADAGSETLTDFTIDVGLPISLKKWEKVNFMLRPGVKYNTVDYLFDADADPFTADTKEKINTFGVSGEFEVEVMLAENFSVSAAHGLAYTSTKLDVSGAESVSGFGTTGNNFTTIGFHVYLW
ncbi:MAG: hypothetical protein ABIU54_07875 [Candidatus Eisenbacteria bacterium]